MLDEVESWNADNTNDKCNEKEHHDSFNMSRLSFLFDCRYMIAPSYLLVNKKPRFSAGFLHPHCPQAF
jgi:hypothetical protein